MRLNLTGVLLERLARTETAERKENMFPIIPLFNKVELSCRLSLGAL